jgi:hypothetical protein
LHASGLVCSFASAKIAVPFDGQRLAASLLIPISRQGLTTVIARAFLTDGGESDAA